MLFDLQGKRRRVVQVTYLGLAVLMGGGLVLFGIGGDVSGGLLDAFKGGNSGGKGNDIAQKRVDEANKTLATSPRDQVALKSLVRGNYQLALSEADARTGVFPAGARDELRKSAAAWERYLALEPKKPDSSLALTAIRVYDVPALNKPAKAARAATLAAEAKRSPAAYVRVVQYADLAGNKRLENLAGQKAIDLARKGERARVRKQVVQAKQTKAQLDAARKAQQGGSAPPQ